MATRRCPGSLTLVPDEVVRCVDGVAAVDIARDQKLGLARAQQLRLRDGNETHNKTHAHPGILCVPSIMALQYKQISETGDSFALEIVCHGLACDGAHTSSTALERRLAEVAAKFCAARICLPVEIQLRGNSFATSRGSGSEAPPPSPRLCEPNSGSVG